MIFLLSWCFLKYILYNNGYRPGNDTQQKNLSLFLNFLNTRYFTSNSYVTTNGVYMA